MRENDEIGEALRQGARSLGERAMRLADEEKPPAVGAGAPRGEVLPSDAGPATVRAGSVSPLPPAERLTKDERSSLDRLVEEKAGE